MDRLTKYSSRKQERSELKKLFEWPTPHEIKTDSPTLATPRILLYNISQLFGRSLEGISKVKCRLTAPRMFNNELEKRESGFWKPEQYVPVEEVAEQDHLATRLRNETTHYLLQRMICATFVA